jgi:hypothetical protein
MRTLSQYLAGGLHVPLSDREVTQEVLRAVGLFGGILSAQTS